MAIVPPDGKSNTTIYEMLLPEKMESTPDQDSWSNQLQFIGNNNRQEI